MSDTNNTGFAFDMPKGKSSIIKVIGVGGGGNNALKHMYEKGINGVDFIICNTDAQTLDNNPISTKVQLGVSITEGLGAGADPEVGEKAAIESIDDIKASFGSNTKMAFVTAGMGGGTGTGAAPVIAKVAKEMGILTVGIVTIPFSFEGKRRLEQANSGLEKLRANVDSLIVINNDKLRQQFGNLGFKASFSKADEVLTNAAKGMAEVITGYFDVNIDFRDAKTVLQNSGTALMSSGVASGENRAEEAVRKALDSPLLNDNKITGAKNVLLLIRSGHEEITMDEIGNISDHIQSEAGDTAEIIFGVGTDEELGDAVSVLVIATGFSKEAKIKSGPAVIQKTKLYGEEPIEKKPLFEPEARKSPEKRAEDRTEYFRLDEEKEEESPVSFSIKSEDESNDEEAGITLHTDSEESTSRPAKAHTASLFDTETDEDEGLSFSFEVERPVQPEQPQNTRIFEEEKPSVPAFRVKENPESGSSFRENKQDNSTNNPTGSFTEIKAPEVSETIPQVQPQQTYAHAREVKVDTEKSENNLVIEEIDFEEFTFRNKTVDNPKVNERRNKLQEFNARYNVVDEKYHFENIPAYKRKNIQLEDSMGSRQNITNYLKEEDGELKLKGNRFLNRDVD